MLFCVGLSVGCWSWNVDNRILIIIFNTYFTVLITFWYRHLIFFLQVIMVSTRNSRVFIPSVTTRKVGAKKCEAKDVILVLNRGIARQEKRSNLVVVLGSLKMIVNLIK